MNLVHRITYPERFAKNGYLNDTGLYSRPGGYDALGRPTQWINSPALPDGYFVALDAGDSPGVSRRIGWFGDPEEGFPRTAFVLFREGRLEVRHITMDAFLTGYECRPGDGDFRNVRRENLLPVVPSGEYRLFAGLPEEPEG